MPFLSQETPRDQPFSSMQEVLSKHAEFNVPLKEVEYYELSLLEEANQLGTRHYVQQFHCAWSEVDGQLMWDEEEKEYFWILDKAKRRYAERRQVLAEKGFIYSV